MKAAAAAAAAAASAAERRVTSQCALPLALARRPSVRPSVRRCFFPARGDHHRRHHGSLPVSSNLSLPEAVYHPRWPRRDDPLADPGAEDRVRTHTLSLSPRFPPRPLPLFSFSPLPLPYLFPTLPSLPLFVLFRTLPAFSIPLLIPLVQQGLWGVLSAPKGSGARPLPPTHFLTTWIPVKKKNIYFAKRQKQLQYKHNKQTQRRVSKRANAYHAGHPLQC